MARIRVAETRDWTDALVAVLHAAGHEVTNDAATDAATVEFIAADSPLEGREDVLTLIVAGMDQVEQALESCKRGAYAFVRYPFVIDEVTLLIERAIDHQQLAHEAHDLRQQLNLSSPAAVAAGAAAAGGAAGAALSSGADVAADVPSVARNLAGKPLADIEKHVILSTLEQFKGHRVRTATALGIGVRTLGMKIKRWREEGEPIVSRVAPAHPQQHQERTMSAST
jgi:DNA-binding NtrC family response regulator